MDNFDRKESAKQIKAFAFKVQRRLQSAGAASHSLEDVEQELWIAWCLACESYDPKFGASFKTYLHRGMQLHINRYVLKNVTRRHDEVIAQSLDAEIGEDGGSTLQDVIASDDPLPCEAIERESSFALAMKRMSPRARQFITILKDQPAEILEETRKLEEKALYAKSIGHKMPVSHRLTASMIFDLMDAGRVERKKITDELERVGARLSR